MNINDFKASLPYLFEAQITPFVWGHAGIGKSSIVKQYAKEKGYHFFPFYLGTQSDIGDILGLAEFVRDKNGNPVSTKFATPEWLMKVIAYCEENPESGAVIFLDEFNRARRDILSGIFSLALDKSFHTIQLPRNCYIVAAGNPPTDEYNVTDVNETALMARFAHIKLEPTFDEWVKYAKDKRLESTLISFLQQQPELLEEKRSNFELPVKVDRRSFERLSQLFDLKTPNHLLEQLMPGIIGLERTVAYMRHLKESDKALTGAEILNKKGFEMLEKWADPKDLKASLLNVTTDNVKDYIISLEHRLLDAQEKSNLMSFLQTVPKDISFPLINDLTRKNTAIFKDFYNDALYKQQMIDLVKASRGLTK